MAQPASHPYGDLPVAVSRAAARRNGRSDSSLRAALRRGDVLRPLRGAYVHPGRISVAAAFYRYPDAERLIAASHAALAVLPEGSVLADQTAAFVHCGLWPTDARPRILVPAPATCSRRPGTLVREGMLRYDDVDVIDGLRLTSGTRTALDLGRRAPRAVALAALDALLRARVTTIPDLISELDRWAGHRGVLQARDLLCLADARAESPGESRVRLALLDAGLGPVEPQVPVCGGRYRVDLVVRGRVIVEFEGSHHDLPDAQFADRRRFNAVNALAGMQVLRYTSRDLARLGSVVAEVRAALKQ